MRVSVCRLVLAALPAAIASADSGEVVTFFKATDLQGQPVSLGDLVAHRRVAVFFWDSRRPASTRAMRDLDHLQDLYRKQGLEVVAVEGEGSPVAQILERVEKLRAIGAVQQYTIVPDPGGSIARQFHVESTPQIFLLDGAGRVFFHLEGFSEDDEPVLEKRIREDLGIVPPPAPQPAVVQQPVALPPDSASGAPGALREPVPFEDPIDAAVKKYRYFGNYYLNLGELDRAEDFFRKIVEVAPNDAAAWLHIGESCARQRRYDKAREAWEQVLRIEPGNKDADTSIRRLIRGEY